MSDIKLLEGVLADAVDDIGHGHNPVDVIRNAIETATEEEREARGAAEARADDLASRLTIRDLHAAEIHEAMCSPVPQPPMDVSSPESWERGYMAARMVVVRMGERHARQDEPAEVTRVTVGYGCDAHDDEITLANGSTVGMDLNAGDVLDIVRRKP